MKSERLTESQLRIISDCFTNGVQPDQDVLTRLVAEIRASWADRDQKSVAYEIARVRAEASAKEADLFCAEKAQIHEFFDRESVPRADTEKGEYSIFARARLGIEARIRETERAIFRAEKAEGEVKELAWYRDQLAKELEAATMLVADLRRQRDDQQRLLDNVVAGITRINNTLKAIDGSEIVVPGKDDT